MFQKRSVTLSVFMIGLAVLAACGGRANTAPLPTETAATESSSAAVLETMAVPLAAVTPARPAPADAESTVVVAAPSTEQGDPFAAPLSETGTPPQSSGLETVACDGTLTPAQAEGPFYTPNTPERTSLIEPGMGGTPLLVTGKVLDQTCKPLAGVMLDFWQTDEHGEYDNVGYRMRGHQYTDQDGNYRLETILPGRYPGRTPHIHVKLFAPDGREALTSQIYIRGVSDQIADRIFHEDLLARDLEPEAGGRRHVAFDFVLPD